jgi:Na+-driven multidrug efflux pump
VTVLQIFSVTLILVYVDFILVNTVLASDKQRRWSFVALIAVPLNVLLNYLLIPYTQTHYGNGGLGAAVTTFITESFIMINAVALVPKGILRVSRIGVPLKGVVSGIVMLGSVLLLRSWAFPWIAQAVVAIVVYYALLLPLKVLNSAELSFIRAFFTFRNLMSTFAPSREAKL